MTLRTVPTGRSRILALALASLALALVPACAPKTARPTLDSAQTAQEAAKQREMAVRDFHAKELRLHDVEVPLLLANAELCGERVAPLLGLRIFTSGLKEDKDWRAAWEAVTQTGDRLVVVSVGKGSPAEAAGVLEGDELISLDGESLPAGKAGYEQFMKGMGQRKDGAAPVDLGLRRQGQEIAVQVVPRLACNYPTMLQLNSEVNAYADGKKIVVFSGMMDFVRSDDELGLIVGHELAHNAMGHVEAKSGNAALGGLFGVVLTGLTGVNLTGAFQQMGAGAFSQEFEHEADYVGLYYSARAGYDIAREPELWRRMAVQHPAAINRGSTHPPTAERFVALEAAVKEVKDKQAAGQPLEPNMKGD